ncbi:MAG TPA: tripartite tricarboxylate transporter substrate-binding protein [Xanthobacteraceae bacterium]|nr:tripartite tricarboxylate transporter substrate-binding protein [Xanthobacteraceae bacterium]
MHTRRQLITRALAAPLVIAAARRARAQGAGRPLVLVVGFPPGGGTDIIARIVAERLRVPFASAVIVENKPGAAARASVDFVKNAEPDGHVMLFTPDFPITVYPHSFRALSYDPLRDLVPVATAARSMLTYSIGQMVPASVKSLADFVQWCKANPASATYATTAAGGTPHFVGVMFANAAGLAMTPVHYRGGAPAIQDLIGGHVPASVNPISETLSFAHSGSLRILAVTGPERSPFLPEVPTMREQGFDVVVVGWLGGFVPAKTPSEVVRALGAAMGEAVKAPDMAAALAKFGNVPSFQGPDAFAATVRDDLARWGPVVKASGFVAVD